MLLLLILCFQIEWITEIDLGGPRSPRVKIASSADAYDVIVSFVPVTCFDENTNRRVTIDRSKYYAMLALVKHLQINPGKTLDFGRAKVISESAQGAQRVIHLKVFDVSINQQTVLEPVETLGVLPKTYLLLDVKNEYEITLKQLIANIVDETPAYRGNLLVFYSDMIDFSEHSLLSFEILSKEIESESLLLRIEKDELLDAIQKHGNSVQSQLLKQIRSVEDFLASPNK